MIITKFQSLTLLVAVNEFLAKYMAPGYEQYTKEMQAMRECKEALDLINQPKDLLS